MPTLPKGSKVPRAYCFAGGDNYPTEKLRALREWPTPKNRQEIKRFLNLCTDYKRFLSCSANIAKLVTKFTENKAFTWTPEYEAAFQAIKGAFHTGPILAYPQPGERFVVETNASNVEIGGVTSHLQDGHERVTIYYSKTLNKAERNYCVNQHELLAFIRTLEHFINASTDNSST